MYEVSTASVFLGVATDIKGIKVRGSLSGYTHQHPPPRYNSSATKTTHSPYNLLPMCRHSIQAVYTGTEFDNFRLDFLKASQTVGSETADADYKVTLKDGLPRGYVTKVPKSRSSVD